MYTQYQSSNATPTYLKQKLYQKQLSEGRN